jgi:hypothetical protein
MRSVPKFVFGRTGPKSPEFLNEEFYLSRLFQAVWFWRTVKLSAVRSLPVLDVAFTRGARTAKVAVCNVATTHEVMLSPIVHDPSPA